MLQNKQKFVYQKHCLQFFTEIMNLNGPSAFDFIFSPKQILHLTFDSSIMHFMSVSDPRGSCQCCFFLIYHTKKKKTDLDRRNSFIAAMKFYSFISSQMRASRVKKWTRNMRNRWWTGTALTHRSMKYDLFDTGLVQSIAEDILNWEFLP